MQRAPDYDPAESGLTAATAVLESLPLPVLVLDQRECIRFANAPIVHLFGYALAELIDKPVAFLFPADLRPHDPAPFSQWLATRFKSPDESTLRMQGVRKDGRRAAFSLKVGRLETRADPFAVCIVEDDAGTGIQNLALTQRRLNEAQRIAKVGSWTWDIPTNTHWWSDELYRLLEVEPNTAEQPYERFLAMVHPQDRPRLDQVRLLTFAGQDIDPADVRIRLPSGEERVIQVRGRATLGAGGQPMIAHGTLQDITEQRVTQTALKLTELRYRETQRLAKIGNWEWDLINGKSWWSDELYQILEEDPEQYPADFDSFLQRVHPADRADLQKRQ